MKFMSIQTTVFAMEVLPVKHGSSHWTSWLQFRTDNQPLARSVLASACAGEVTASTTNMGRYNEELAERLVYGKVRIQVANICIAEPVLRTWSTKPKP